MKLVRFAGDDRQPRRRAEPAPVVPVQRNGVAPAALFAAGLDTVTIALKFGWPEARVLKSITRERCHRLGLPDPYANEAAQ